MSVGPSEKTVTVQRGSAWVKDAVDGVKFGSNHAGEERVLYVVDAATPLDNVNIALLETMSNPTECVGLAKMVRVQHCDDVALCVWERQEMVDVGRL